MQMQTSSAPLLTAAKLAELVALGRNRISQIYLHWTAGRYGQLYDDYHFNIDADGSIYQTCKQLTELKSHTWHRNTGAIGIALCCACGALPHNGRDTEFGKFPPTPRQINAAGKLVAKLAQGLNIPIDRRNILTHCEAALIDGYGPYSGDAETRWDLWVSARFTRRRSNEARRAGHQGQGPVVCKKQPPCLKGLLFKEHDVFF